MHTPSVSIASERPVHVIVPTRGWLPIDLREIWEFRELLLFFAWREIRIRYKQTVLGVTWAVIQPLTTMVVFSLVFGKLGKLPSDGLPYPIFAYCALLPWQFFSFGLSEASHSVVSNQGVITKVYFPRVILPAASVFVGLVDFAISLVVLFGLMAYFHIGPTPAIWTLPLWSALVAITAFGGGLWLSALNVRYRDIRYVIPFLVNLGLFASPVAYSSSQVPEQWRALYALNPMVGVIEGFRWALLGAGRGPDGAVAVSVAVAVIVTAGGLFYFRRMERSFADVV